MNIYSLQLGFGLEVPGKISLNIYFSGCKDNKPCRNLCHNKELHSFSNGKYWKDFIPKINRHIETNLVECICLLGGEPLDQDELNEFIDLFKIPIYLYTGYDIDVVDKSKFKGIFYGPYDPAQPKKYWEAT